jgi:hypothetical protein
LKHCELLQIGCQVHLVACRPTKSHTLGVILTLGAFTFSIPTLCSTYLYWSYGNLTPGQLWACMYKQPDGMRSIWLQPY